MNISNKNLWVFSIGIFATVFTVSIFTASEVAIPGINFLLASKPGQTIWKSTAININKGFTGGDATVKRGAYFSKAELLTLLGNSNDVIIYYGYKTATMQYPLIAMAVKGDQNQF